MADPLSIAASVVGLLTAAVQTTQILNDVINKARHAPDDCRRIKSEVDDIRNVLGQLQLFILRINVASRSRTSLLMVDQVVATLSSCVLTFSDLQVFVEGLQTETGMGILDRIRWMSKDTELKTTVNRLETHKNSLTLMLTILTCQLQIEAESKVDRLCLLIEEKILGENPMLAARLAAFESPHADSHTIISRQQDSARESRRADLDHLSLSMGECGTTPKPEVNNNLEGLKRDNRGFAFEELLLNSRAYRQAAHNNSDAFSVVSSAGRTASWSMLSGMSLSEMSSIAILALPIYASDVNNKEVYDFEPARDEPATSSKQTAAMAPSPDTQAKSSRKKWLKDLIRIPTSPDQSSTAENVVQESEIAPIFGVPIVESIRYANVAISVDTETGPFIYGYIPFIVAKTGVFLKIHGSETENIFAQNGNPTRLLRLRQVFNSPPRYGKGHDWAGYTVYDAAGLLLRYLKSLPEPIIPFDAFSGFTSPFRRFINEDDIVAAATTTLIAPKFADIIKILQRCIAQLPPLSRQLLLYVIDILAVYASKSELNKMSARRLVAAFQPALLSKQASEMDADEHHLAAQTMVFMVEWQDDIITSFTEST